MSKETPQKNINIFHKNKHNVIIKSTLTKLNQPNKNNKKKSQHYKTSMLIMISLQ